MFSRKRRFYEKKSFYAAVATAFVAVVCFSLWFNGDLGSDPQKTPVEDQSLKEEISLSSNNEEDQRGGQSSESKGTEPDVTVSGAEVLDRPLSEGYFVIEEDGYIRIYQVDSQGKKTAVRTSEILFDLLSQEDQEMFRLGVELQNEDQLMELLQDFDS